MRRGRTGAIRATATFAALCLLLSPFFFLIYRTSVFKTLPYDDYAPYLLWLTGNPQGAFPDSPYGYRLLSMIAALPFYYGLPALHLTNIPADVSAAYLKATAALSAVAFLSAVAGATLVAHLARERCGLGRAESALAGVLLFVLYWYAQINAVDSPALTLIVVGLYLLERPTWFAGLILVSVAFNEKIALVLAIWLSIRCVLHRADRLVLRRQWIAAILGVALYVAVVKLVHLPGNAYQLSPSEYPATVAENLAAYFTGRGLLLNVLPVIVLGAIAVTAGRSPAQETSILFRRGDVFVIPALVVVALFLTHLYQAGRIVMHAAPLFVVPAIGALFPRADRARLDEALPRPTAAGRAEAGTMTARVKAEPVLRTHKRPA
jgi:hypothetical protein